MSYPERLPVEQEYALNPQLFASVSNALDCLTTGDSYSDEIHVPMKAGSLSVDCSEYDTQISWDNRDLLVVDRLGKDAIDIKVSDIRVDDHSIVATILRNFGIHKMSTQGTKTIRFGGGLLIKGKDDQIYDGYGVRITKQGRRALFSITPRETRYVAGATSIHAEELAIACLIPLEKRAKMWTTS